MSERFENLHSPEVPATFDALYTLSSMIRGARLAGNTDYAARLRDQVQQLYADSDYHELREVYAAMCAAYRSNEDLQSSDFDPAIRSAWIDLHAHLEGKYPKEFERTGELFLIDAAALQRQAETRAEIEHGSMPEQRAMPEHIPPAS